MTVTVLLFARGRELAGADRVRVELSPGATVGDLRAALGRTVPPLRPLLESSAIAIDHRYARDDESIAVTAEIALLPPVSGG